MGQHENGKRAVGLPDEKAQQTTILSETRDRWRASARENHLEFGLSDRALRANPGRALAVSLFYPCEQYFLELLDARQMGH
jgi:hypothetical protein